MRSIQLPMDESGHSAPITHVAFRPDGHRLATCSYDGSVLIWDTSAPQGPQPLQRLHHRRLVNASAWNPAAPSLLATAAADKTVAVWRVPDDGHATIVNVLARHTDDINSVAWMPDGERLICVSEDGRATMWDAFSGQLLGEVSSHAAHCMMVAVNNAGMVATVGEDGMVTVATPDSDLQPLVRQYESSIEGCSWSHSGAMLAVARDDGAVDLLDAGLELVRTVQVSTSAARTVDWAHDDSAFVVGAYDGSLHIFDLDGHRLHRYDDARMWPRSVAINGGLVAAGSFWNSPHLIDLASAAEIASPNRPTHGPNALAVDGDGLLIGTDSGLVVRVEVPAADTTRRPRRQQLTAGPILSLSTSGDTVYAGTYSGHVIRTRGDDITISAQLGAPVPSLVSTGGALVAGTYNGELIALDPTTLAVRERSQAHGGSVKALTPFSGDGFLSAATDRTVAVGSLHDRTVLWQHGNLVNAVASLGGTVVASASRDHTVKVGRVALDETGGWRLREVRTLLGADESVKCIGLLGTVDKPVVVAGSYDFGLHVWQVDWADASGGLVNGRVLEPFTQGVSCMAQIDGDRIAVAGWDGRIVVIGTAGTDDVQVLWSATITDLVEDLVAA